MNEVTAGELLAPQKPASVYEYRRGLIRVNIDVMEQFGIDMRGCTTQGEFADHGIFAALLEKLLLPESYKILGIFLSWAHHYWEIVVESLDLPLVEPENMPPDVEPRYQRRDDGTVRLVSIRIGDRWQCIYDGTEMRIDRFHRS